VNYRSHHLGQAPASAPAPASSAPSGVATDSSAAARVAALPQLAVMARPAAPPPINIVPSWCTSVPAVDVSQQGPGANQIAVLTYPIVKFTDDQVQGLLNAIYGNGAGGDALVTGTAQAIAQGVVTSAPTFVASGWVRDDTANQNVTRGALWLAFGWNTAVTAANFMKFANMIVTAGTGVDPTPGVGGTYSSTPTSKAIAPGLVPKLASDNSDASLLAAAAASAAGTIIGLTIFAQVFSFGGVTAVTDTTAPPSIAVSLQNATAQVHQAVAAVASLPTLLASVPQVAAQVAAATPDTCHATIDAMHAVRAAIVSARDQTNAGLVVARAVIDGAQAETQPGGGSVADAIRAQMQAAADRAVSSSSTNYKIAKPLLQCAYYRGAQTSLAAALQSTATALASANADAQTLVDNTSQITQVLAQVDPALAVLDAAEQQSCLEWYWKKWYGMPVAYWVGGGASLFLATAVVVRVRRKRAATVKVTANRRRTTSRRVR